MSKITIVVNALRLGCSLEAGGGLGKLLTAPTWGEAWGSLGGGGGGVFYVASHKQNFGLEPGRAGEGLARRRAGPFAADAACSFAFLSPGPLGPQWLVWRSVVSRNSWSRLGLFARCPPPFSPPPPPPVPSPSPRWQMNGGFNEHGRGVGQAVLKML